MYILDPQLLIGSVLLLAGAIGLQGGIVESYGMSVIKRTGDVRMPIKRNKSAGYVIVRIEPTYEGSQRKVGYLISDSKIYTFSTSPAHEKELIALLQSVRVK